jgi:hypothetical protein
LIGLEHSSVKEWYFDGPCHPVPKRTEARTSHTKAKRLNSVPYQQDTFHMFDAEACHDDVSFQAS